MTPAQNAMIMRNLMQRLGFTQYYIHGGDLGHTIGSYIATAFPKEVLGFHSNSLVDLSPMPMIKWLLGSLWPSLFVEEEVVKRMYPLKDRIEVLFWESGYVHLQGTKPDTIGKYVSNEKWPGGL